MFSRPPPPLPDDAAYVAAMRRGYLDLSSLAGPPEPVARVEDMTARGPNGEVPLRRYTPAGAGPAPLLVWFHGGSFVAGDLDSHDPPLRALANRSGCAVLAVGYRLAPEHPYPAGIEDCYAALLWAAAQSSGPFAVGGDSAGGNLATVTAMLARDRGGPPIALQVMLYPDADARDGYHYEFWRDHDGKLLDRAHKDRQVELYLPPGADRHHAHISPALAPIEALRGLPPALIVTGEADPQRDEGELYAARLREAGVEVAHTRYRGMVHGFFQMASRFGAARQLIAQVGDAVAALRNTPEEGR